MNSSVGQLELALLRAHLHTFERRFYRALGPRYVELDEARAQAAKLRSRFVPAAHRESLAARDQARVSAQEYAHALSQPAPDPDKLRRLHHDLARHFHPDLASDQARRLVREQLMTEVNLAYHEGDLRRLEILETALDHDQNGDAARQLAELARSSLARLREQDEYEARHKRDLLGGLAAYVGRLIEDARQRGPRMLPTSSRQATLVDRAVADLATFNSSRRLAFPSDRSMGELSMRAERDINAPVQALGAARGAISAPFGKALILRLDSTCDDLAPLAQLDPGDLQGIIDEWPDFVNLNDAQVRPLARFHSLEEIHLGRTEITGRVFDGFPSLHQLRVLILDETQFDDVGLLRLEDCVWMQRLDLSFTLVTGPGLRAIDNMTALRDLSLYGTAVSDADLDVLDRIPGLRNLNLGLTAITDRSARRLDPLHALEVLNLGGTGITDAILDPLGELSALRELVLWETAVTPAGLDKVRAFPALRYLDVDQTGVTPETLAAFRCDRPDVRLPSDIWADTQAT